MLAVGIGVVLLGAYAYYKRPRDIQPNIVPLDPRGREINIWKYTREIPLKKPVYRQINAPKSKSMAKIHSETSQIIKKANLLFHHPYNRDAPPTRGKIPESYVGFAEVSDR